MDQKLTIPVIVIYGPTASGKSALAVQVAKSLGGEIISADSRQVYQGLDIGAGKITKKEMAGVPHHLLGIASPKSRYTVARYLKDARKIILRLHKSNTPIIICGGTGFYINALVGGITLENVPPNEALRARLAKLPLNRLSALLKDIDQKRWQEIDKQNPARLIRAIEIAKGRKNNKRSVTEKVPNIEALIIGITWEREALKKRIEKRLKERIQKGMVREVKRLIKAGVPKKRLLEMGLEYRHTTRHLEKEIDLQELVATLNTEIFAYAKRQVTYANQFPQIQWFSGKELHKRETYGNLISLCRKTMLSSLPARPASASTIGRREIVKKLSAK